jgi:intracellular septation protein
MESPHTRLYVWTMNPILKLALDLGPLLLFFVANAVSGIFTATAVFMLAMAVAITIGIVLEKRVSPVALVTGVLVLIFGSLTLWLSNDIFIKIKPTILYAMFSVVLLGGLRADRLFIKYLLGQNMRLPDPAWRTLTWRWAAFFLVLALANEIVWRNVSTNGWVAFKVWGVFPLTLLFALAQAPFIARHHIESDEAPPAT